MSSSTSSNPANAGETANEVGGMVRQVADNLRSYTQQGRRPCAKLLAQIVALEPNAPSAIRLALQAVAPIVRDDADNPSAAALALDPIIRRTPRGSVGFDEVDGELRKLVEEEADSATVDTYLRFHAAVCQVFHRPGSADPRELEESLSALAEGKISGLAWMDWLSAGRGQAVARAAAKALARKDHWKYWRARSPQYAGQVQHRLASLQERSRGWVRWLRVLGPAVAAGLVGLSIPLAFGSSKSVEKPAAYMSAATCACHIQQVASAATPAGELFLPEVSGKPIVVVTVSPSIDNGAAMAAVSAALARIATPPATPSNAATQPATVPAPKPPVLIPYADTRAGRLLPAAQLGNSLRVLAVMQQIDALGGAEYAVVVRSLPGGERAAADLVVLGKRVAAASSSTRPATFEDLPLGVIAPRFCTVPMSSASAEASKSDLYPMLRAATSCEQLAIAAEALAARTDATAEDLAASAVAYLVRPPLDNIPALSPQLKEARARQLLVEALQRTPVSANEDARSLAHKALKTRFAGLETDEVKAAIEKLK